MRPTSRAPSLRAGDVLRVLALAAVAAWAGCTKSTLYTYFSVHVRIDSSTVSNDQLVQVSSCVFEVSGAEVSQPKNLNCPPRNVHFEVGTFEWETQAQQGALQFAVRIFDSNLVLIGQGTSESVTIAPGKHLPTVSVLVVGVQAPTADGGTMADASTPDDDDAATANDGGSDGADGAIADRANDAATTDLAPDAGTADAAATDAATGDGGPPDAGAADAPRPSDATPDFQSADRPADATTDGNTDRSETG